MYKVSLFNNNVETVINAVGTSQDIPKLKSGTIKQGINTIDTFEFSIYPNNPGYNLINARNTLVKVWNTKTNRYDFEGRVLLPGENMGDTPLVKSVTCESELGYLQDSTQTYVKLTNPTPTQILTAILNRHNSQVEATKHFVLGNVTVTSATPTGVVEIGYDKTWNVIQNLLINVYGGELRIRKENNQVYLDYLIQTGGKKSTEIRLARNIKTIEQDKDPSGVITRLVPLGAKLNGTEQRLTIKSVNNNIEYLDNLEGQAEFGIVQDSMIWDDVTDPVKLKAGGVVALNNATKTKKQYKITALDLSTIDLDTDSFEVGNTYTVINPVMGINEDLRIIEKTIDIFAPQNSQLTFGDKFETMSGKQASVQKLASQVMDMMTGTGNIGGSFLSGYVDLLRVQMGAMADSAEKQQAKAILFEDRIAGSPTFGAMALGTQGFMISDQLDSNNDWIWKTFGTGKGFIADMLMAGTLAALDGSFKISLDSGHFSTYAGGKIAIDMYNQSIDWHDWQGSAGLTGQIESARILDAQGNPTGKQVLSINVPHNCYLDLASEESDGSNIPILRISNFADSSSKRQVSIMEDVSIYKRDDPTHGIAITDGKLNSYADVDLHGWTLNNIGTITTSSGKTSWSGTSIINGVKMEFEHGILVNSEQV